MPKQRFSTYIIISASVITLLAAAYFINSRKPTESVNYTRSAMGTVVELTLMKGDQTRYDEAAEAAFAEIERLEALLSSYRPESDLSRINRSAGEATVEVAPEVIAAVKAGLKVSLLSSGAFDPTVGVLAGVWGPSGEKGIVPSQDDLQRLLPLVDYRGVVVDEAAGKAGLAKRGSQLPAPVAAGPQHAPTAIDQCHVAILGVIPKPPAGVDWAQAQPSNGRVATVIPVPVVPRRAA